MTARFNQEICSAAKDTPDCDEQLDQDRHTIGLGVRINLPNDLTCDPMKRGRVNRRRPRLDDQVSRLITPFLPIALLRSIRHVLLRFVNLAADVILVPSRYTPRIELVQQQVECRTIG